MNATFSVLSLLVSSQIPAEEPLVLNETLMTGKGAWGAFNISFSPDGRVLASHHNVSKPLGRGRFRFESRIALWNVETGERLGLSETVPGQIQHVQFLPSGDRLAASRAYQVGHEVSFWKVADGGRSLKYHKPQFVREVGITSGIKTTRDQIVTSLAASPNGEYLAVFACYGQTNNTSTLRIWPKAGGSQSFESKDIEDFHVKDLCFSSDSRHVMTLTTQPHSKGGGFILTTRDATNPEKVIFERHFKDRPRNCSGLAAIPDSTRVAIGGQDKVSIFDLETQKEASHVKTPVPAKICKIAVSKDGRFLAAATELGQRSARVLLWNLKTGQFLSSYAHLVRDLEFSPDSRFLASSGNHVKLWSMAQFGGGRTKSRNTNSPR